MPSSDTAIKTIDLGRIYRVRGGRRDELKTRVALADVNLEVPTGEFYGRSRPNAVGHCGQPFRRPALAQLAACSTRYNESLCVLCALCGNEKMLTTNLTWGPDVLDGFEAAAIALPDAFDGPAAATLVRRRAQLPTGRAVLYLHGFVDYFFQTHLALAYNEHGYDFYALDLRRHGRSLRPHQRPNFCTDLGEYYAEIDRAIELIGAEGHGWLLLNGHSTGGLIAALYADEGDRRDQISALFLNSPFFDLNATPARRAQAAVFTLLGGVLPTLPLAGVMSPPYGQSIHCDYHGEWSFDLRWKPIGGFQAYAGWLRAIVAGQRRLQAGLHIACPILIMHSARSARATVWSKELSGVDCVLDVAHMRGYGPELGRDVTIVAVEGGMHDLVLSPTPVRERVFAELFGWLEGRAVADDKGLATA